ncbi:MAG: hypothetical protein EOR95_03675 [Mesorhizobium sp.]|nr:MAG: hypothetical protein EOR95_03675 [Mesorhizobium sp.]
MHGEPPSSELCPHDHARSALTDGIRMGEFRCLRLHPWLWKEGYRTAPFEFRWLFRLVEMRAGGYKRHCPACGTEHFPRTDPVVIICPSPVHHLIRAWADSA